MTEVIKDGLTSSNSEKKLATVTFSPLVIPGDFFFGLYQDDTLKIEGGFEIGEVVLSKHLPLVDQNFADKAIILEQFKLAFEHSLISDPNKTSDQFVLSLTLNLLGHKLDPLVLQLAGNTKKQVSPTTSSTAVAPNNSVVTSAADAAGASVYWISIQKALGPLYLEKIGFNFIGDDLQVILNAGLNTSVLSIGLSGLSVTIPIFDLNSIEDLKVDLKGLEITFNAGAVNISGGLLRTKQANLEEYDGNLLIKASNFSITALGSYAKMKINGQDETSLFAFAILNANIGGPPCFFVTGLSAGFGYNRSVKIPSINEVSTFPLLAGLKDPNALGLPVGGGMPKASELANVLSKLSVAIPIDPGEYWFAAGVQFTTFELLFSNVVLVVEVGKEFEILILGKSVASFPPAGGTQYAYVELDLEVVLIPDHGLFKAEAMLSSNSYLLDQACHLTGGFAFFSWFANNQHAGDFVFTVGGYHPAFKAPSHYPTVSRVGFNWTVSSEVFIKGGVYFALTPSCMMAGGSLEALFQSGELRAWFTAYADMLIYWKPFYFIADIGIDVGVSYHVHFLFISTTLKLEVGANLYLYGPPTGGRVHVSLWIVSFTVPFGADESSSNLVIEWNDFKTMLPQSKKSTQGVMLTASNRVMLTSVVANDMPIETGIDVCHINVINGLLNTVQDNSGVSRWLIRADELIIGVESSIPTTEIKFDKYSIKSDSQSQLYIRPMQKTITASTNIITVVSEDGNPIEWKTPDKSNKNLPTAMWGKVVTNPSSIDLNDRIVPDCLVGITNLSAATKSDFGSTGLINISDAFGDVPIYLDGGGLPSLPLSQSATECANNALVVDQSTSSIINPGIITTASKRQLIADALGRLIAFTVEKENLSAFNAVTNFAGQPLVGSLSVN